MKTVVDARLVEESARFALRHRCEDCAHWDGARCGDAWPTAPHRVPMIRDAIVVFCKGFEGA